MSTNRKRIVITGLGCVTPLGLTVKDFWRGLSIGQSGIKSITTFDTTNLPIKVAAEINNFIPENCMNAKVARRTGRFIHFGIVSAAEATKSAGLDLSREDLSRIGVVIGTMGDFYQSVPQMDIIREKGYRLVDPCLSTKISGHSVSSQIGFMLGVKGPNTTVNSACASGADAIGTAVLHLRSGNADVMLAGGTESIINPLVNAMLGRIGALSKETDPKLACRPFDLHRNGFVVGEGAGVVVLETLEHAQSRGAPIMAELAGIGWSFDAFNDTAPDIEGQATAMKLALKDAGVGADDVDYVSAHGTSTKLNDVTETKAIKLTLGNRASQIPVSSNKSMIGHIIGAAGAIGAIVSVLTIRESIIPPTINYETPDPECDLDYVPNVARKGKVDAVLSNCFGLGGQNCCLVLKRFAK